MQRFIKATRCGDDDNAFRFQSGRQVLDEILVDGRYLPRYRCGSGQIVPETHVGSQHVLEKAARLGADSAFLIGVNDTLINGNWAFTGFEQVPDDSGLFGEAEVYALGLRDDAAGLALTLYTRLNGSDFIARWMVIENRTDKPLALTTVSPLAGLVWAHSHRPEVLDGGAEFCVAYNHLNNWSQEGDFYFDDVTPAGKHICSDRGRSGYGRPACWLRSRLNGETFVVELGCIGNWEINACAIPSLDKAAVKLDAGLLHMPYEALRVLLPGESARTPIVHFAMLREDDDKIVQLTHEYVRSAIVPPLPDGVPVTEVEANHRGYLCDRETEEGFKRDIDVAKAAGAEMYVVDAGWQGTGEKNSWCDTMGDWVPGPWLKNGLEPIPQYAHQQGLRFGLWAPIEAVGSLTKLRREHGDWVLHRNGLAGGGIGSVLDFAKEEVVDYAIATVSRLIERYALDMYRIDHGMDGPGGTRERGGFNENTCWRYYEGFARVFRTIRAKYPNVILQGCSGGGGRLDWGSMNLFHNTEMSDWMRQPRGVRIMNGVTMSLPPEIMLRTFGTETGSIAMDGNIDSQLRVELLARPIHRGIAPSLEEFTPYLREKFAHFNALYKGFVRPLLKDCLVYHHTPFQPIMTPAAQTILEYAAKDGSRGLLVVYVQTGDGAGRTMVYPRGVKASGRYRVTFDNTGESVELSGIEILRDGLPLRIDQMMGSELILLTAI